MDSELRIQILCCGGEAGKSRQPGLDVALQENHRRGFSGFVFLLLRARWLKGHKAGFVRIKCHQ